MGESTMAFDYKKEYKEFYLPKSTPGFVNVPPMRFVAVRGAGDPNEEGGAYQQAISENFSPPLLFKSCIPLVISFICSSNI